MSVWPTSKSEDGFATNSLSGDTWQDCKAYVRSKLGMPPWEPNKKKDAAKPAKKKPGPVVKAYDYVDDDGIVLFQVTRHDPKEFRQRRPDGNGGWINNLDSVKRVIYRMPEIKKALADGKAVFIVEGEKDADALWSIGIPATTQAQGAATKWLDEYSTIFAEAKVYILPDNDKPGRAYANQVGTSLERAGATVRTIDLPGLPEKGDVSDWLAAGGNAEKLLELTTPKPVDGSAALAMFQRIHQFCGRFILYPSKHAHDAHVLWIAHTHLMDAWEITPRMAFLSAEAGSGKSRCLEVSALMVPNAVQAVNVSPAYLFRKVGAEEGRPTILFDEIDTVFGPKAKENEEIRGLLNAGHHKGAVAGRCVTIGKTVTTEELPAYCAVALAGLGWLPDTIMTRSIIVRMRKRAPGEKVESFRMRIHVRQGNKIRDEIANWAKGALDELTDKYPEMPPGVEDRDADIWESLLAISDHIGGDWPKRAREAAIALVAAGKDREPSLGVKLLADLKTIFGDSEQLTTEAILDHLNNLKESPWSEVNKGKPLNDRGLAQRLRQYEVKPKVIRVGSTTPRGYTRADLQDAWNRYLPTPPTEPPSPTPGKSATSATDATIGNSSNDFNANGVADEAQQSRNEADDIRNMGQSVADDVAPLQDDFEDRNERNPYEMGTVADVADVAHLAGVLGGNGGAGLPICAQCNAGPNTEPPSDYPTVSLDHDGKPIWLHRECRRFWLAEHPPKVAQ